MQVHTCAFCIWIAMTYLIIHYSAISVFYISSYTFRYWFEFFGHNIDNGYGLFTILLNIEWYNPSWQWWGIKVNIYFCIFYIKSNRISSTTQCNKFYTLIKPLGSGRGVLELLKWTIIIDVVGAQLNSLLFKYGHTEYRIEQIASSWCKNNLIWPMVVRSEGCGYVNILQNVALGYMMVCHRLQSSSWY